MRLLPWLGSVLVRELRSLKLCSEAKKKKNNQTKILLLKITVYEMQQNKKCYREHKQQQKTL